MVKEEFVAAMKELVALRKDADAVHDAFKKLDPDFNYISFTRYESLIVKILEQATNDKNQWISYWLYERDFGKSARLGCVRDKKGKPIPIKTPGDLWELIKRKGK